MYCFTVGDIENLCNIRAHTLRTWEQRYAFLKPLQKEGRHRLYDAAGLKQLLCISFLYHQGWKAARLAQLNPEQMLSELHKHQSGKSHVEYFINQLLESSIDFDKRSFEHRLQQIINAVGFEDAIQKVAYPLLAKIELLYKNNPYVPEQDHFCSYIIQHKIIAATDKLPLSPAGAPQVVLFCPHGAYHELPLFYLHYLFRKGGWTTFYLGSGVSVDALQPFADKGKPEYFFLRLNTNITPFSVDDYFEKLCTTFRHKTIVASGRAVFGAQRNFTNLRLLKSDEAIHRFIKAKNV